MRVATSMLRQATLAGIGQNSERLLELQRQIATGTRVGKPSDDPVSAGRALEARTVKRAAEQWQRNLDAARRFATATESSLARIVDLVAEARLAATQAASDVHGDEEMQAFAQQLDSILEQLVDEGNGAEGQVHFYGGTATQRDPFAVTRDADGLITSVSASGAEGADGEMQRLVGDEVLLTINTSASDAFGDGLEVFTHLIELRDAAASADRAAIADLLTAVDEDLERVSVARSVSGLLIQRINVMSDSMEELSLAAEARRSQEEDLDLAEAMVAYQEQQTLLQAALTASSRLLELTLVNFI
jgi:flagellar hook-associated protein 3 FlgL